MNLRTSFRHFGVPAYCFVLLAAAGLTVGCTGGPKLSLTSPSTWPGARQVSGAGHKVGGWVKEKAKWRLGGGKTQAATLARKESSQATLRDETNRKLRAIFTQGNQGAFNQPSDPFLAQTAQATPQVESVSHSSNRTQGNLSTNDRQAANFTSAAHAVDGPQVSIPEEPVPTESNVNPFADLASSPGTQTRERRPVENSFAGGIDAQLAQLRRQTDGSEASQTTNELPAERNAIRDAILGITEDDPQTRRRALPSNILVPVAEFDVPDVPEVPVEVAIEEINQPTEVAEPPVGRAIVRSAKLVDNLLPEWARESAAKPAIRESLPTVETTSVTIPKIDAVGEAPVSPFEESMTSERIHVATNGSHTPLTAIEIVPSRRQFPPETLTNDADATRRVELLPPPPADVVVIEQRGGLKDSGDSFGGMIVETDTLSPGFAEWHGNDGTHATLHTNAPLATQSVRASSDAAVPAHFATNSRPIPTNRLPAEADSDGSNQNSFIIRQPLLREIPSPLPVGNGVLDALQQTPPDSGARLFPAIETGEQALESSLPSVSFDPETEPGAAAGDSLFGSTAVIGLLFGLVCLIGLALIRRMKSTA